jgi:precorrin-3B synthase
VTQILDGAQPRAVADRCPGLLRPHLAEDGLLVRVRLPGGLTDSRTLVELSQIAGDLGEGSLQLTSRGNLQLRGLDEHRMPELVERVAALGLLPSTTHERVRNLVASPLTGLSASHLDLRPLISGFDVALCATPELAELPGRFLFAFDDGGGDMLALRFDLAYLATGHDRGLVLVGDPWHGIATSADDAPGVLLELATRFLSVRAQTSPRPWQLSELADVSVLDERITALPASAAAGPVPLGAVDGAASVGVPLSLLERRQVEAVDRAAGGGPVVVTPWRGLVVPGAAGSLGALAEVGLVADGRSSWSQVTACIGAPGCAKSAISTRNFAAELVARLPLAPAQPVHVSGCERRCGAPSDRHVDLVAPRSLAAALAEVRR